ncbi:MAG: hypothetical protein ACRCZP_10350, partial [Phycicoccus sp.]
MDGPAAVAPVGAAAAKFVLQGIDGSCQVTGCLIEESSTVGTYIDGDSPGGIWTDGDGRSYSVFGPTDMTSTIDWDDDSGRVRAFVQNAAGGAVRVQAWRRPATRTVLTKVRGGSVPLTGGSSVRSADDYEHPDVAGGLVYRFTTHTGAVPLQTGTTQLGVGTTTEPALETIDGAFTPPGVRAWLKFVAAPRYNRRVTITGWSDIERPDRNQLYDVDGRTDPIVVTSGHSSRRTTLTLRTWDLDESRALDEALSQGIPGFLHMPAGSQLPAMYAVFGTYRQRPASRRSQGAVWEVPVVEVAAPPPSIFATPATW